MYRHTSKSVSRMQASFFQRIFAAGAVVAAMAFGAGHASAETIKISAGTTPSSVPNAFLDLKTHEIQGVMPDVIREIGKREGFDVSFDVIPFSTLIQSVVLLGSPREARTREFLRHVLTHRAEDPHAHNGGAGAVA